MPTRVNDGDQSAMARLINIKKQGDMVTCIVYIEGSDLPVNMKYDCSTDEIEHGPLPVGYGSCMAYIHHARRALREMALTGNFAESRTVMWC